MRVRIHTRLRASSFIERSLEIENLSEEALPISHLSPFSEMLSQILDPEEHERDIPYELIYQPDVEQLYEGFIRVLPIANERITFPPSKGVPDMGFLGPPYALVLQAKSLWAIWNVHTTGVWTLNSAITRCILP